MPSDSPPTPSAPAHIRRPRNCFIIYLADKRKELQGNQKDVTQTVGAMWAKEEPEVRQHYARLADMERAEHKRKYPDYRYAP
ncbi:hypothetical protein K474DRAFT_1604724, partial [Panus rudis PR-1116 ss-1]